MKFFSYITAWAQSHLNSCILSFKKMLKNSVGSFLTLVMLAAALSLPSGLYIYLQNLHGVTGNWNENIQISIFLDEDTSNHELENLAKEISKIQAVSHIKSLTKEQALKEFQRFTGYTEIIEDLKSNPLPPTIIIYPSSTSNSREEITLLQNKLGMLPKVNSVRVDTEWIQRLFVIVEIIEKTILIISVLLGVSVILIIGNTVRLEIQNQKEEIIVCKLIGASDAFIRRPFLYGGVWYGVLSGGFAWLIVSAAVWLLRPAVNRLGVLYQNEAVLQNISLTQGSIIVFLAAVLGFLGSRIAVAQHLKAIRPS